MEALAVALGWCARAQYYLFILSLFLVVLLLFLVATFIFVLLLLLCCFLVACFLFFLILIFAIATAWRGNFMQKVKLTPPPSDCDCVQAVVGCMCKFVCMCVFDVAGVRLQVHKYVCLLAVLVVSKGVSAVAC